MPHTISKSVGDKHGIELTLQPIFYSEKKHFIVYPFLMAFFWGCHSGSTINITPHTTNPEADVYFQRAIKLINYYDNDSTKKCIAFINNALLLDSLNPDYYRVKAKLYAELRMLDFALAIQEAAEKIGSINGEYFLQLGLFQAAKGFQDKAHNSFHKSNEYLKALLKKYPDSLEAFITQQAAGALYAGVDSMYMQDISIIRERFPNRQMDIEMARRLKPGNLIKEIKEIEQN